MRPRFLLLICATALAIACGGSNDSGASPSPTAAPKTIELRYEGGSLRAELAVTPQERAVGLGNRASLPADSGMLFVYDAPQTPFYWMKDTLIPLDMIWIGEDKRVVSVSADVQPEPGVPDAQLKHYMPAAPIRYVLEVNAGTAARAGIAMGSQLTFEVPSQ